MASRRFAVVEVGIPSSRRREGQRWVKITYFRDLDLLKTPQARFPIDVIGELIRATAKRYSARPRLRPSLHRFARKRFPHRIHVGDAREPVQHQPLARADDGR